MDRRRFLLPVLLALAVTACEKVPMAVPQASWGYQPPELTSPTDILAAGLEEAEPRTAPSPPSDAQAPIATPVSRQAALQKVIELADASVRRMPAETLAWDWREGLFLYALARLDRHLHQPRYRAYIQAYYRFHQAKGLPEINWSDRCAPGLAALELYRETGDAQYRDFAEKVTAYLKAAKPTKAGGLNHFGTHPFSWGYPDSMWVDSLMMYNVFAARWGEVTGDETMLDFAAQQAEAFAGVLQDAGTQLWKHAYLTNLRRQVPKGETYWLRGNGWAIASLAEVLPLLPADHPRRQRLMGVLTGTAQALLPYQAENGLWHTVINRGDDTYLESSGSALVAYGLIKGRRLGWLSEAAGDQGERAFLALVGRLKVTPEGLSMPDMSHHTMPYPFLGYRLIPVRSDLPHGLAALILAGLAFEGGNLD